MSLLLDSPTKVLLGNIQILCPAGSISPVARNVTLFSLL